MKSATHASRLKEIQMAVLNPDPSLPSGSAPIFSDTDAARGDHLRANNNKIWGNFTDLDRRIDIAIAVAAATKNYIDSILAQKWKFLPAGFEYVQRKGIADPLTIFGGGTWANVSAEWAGLFERIEGGVSPHVAAAYGSTQDDMILDHYHQSWYYTGNLSSGGSGRWQNATGLNNAKNGDDAVRNVIAAETRVGVETRPANATIRVWRLTAY